MNSRPWLHIFLNRGQGQLDSLPARVFKPRLAKEIADSCNRRGGGHMWMEVMLGRSLVEQFPPSILQISSKMKVHGWSFSRYPCAQGRDEVEECFEPR